MSFGNKGPFPEPTHTKHKPSSGHADPTYIRRSEHTPGGHQDHPERMPHPQRDGFQPNSESGEGQGFD